MVIDSIASDVACAWNGMVKPLNKVNETSNLFTYRIQLNGIQIEEFKANDCFSYLRKFTVTNNDRITIICYCNKSSSKFIPEINGKENPGSVLSNFGFYYQGGLDAGGIVFNLIITDKTKIAPICIKLFDGNEFPFTSGVTNWGEAYVTSRCNFGFEFDIK